MLFTDFVMYFEHWAYLAQANYLHGSLLYHKPHESTGRKSIVTSDFGLTAI